MTPFDLLKYAAATWAICYMVTKTHGPFGIFERLREFKGGRWHGRTVKQGIVDTRINEVGGTDMLVGDVVQENGLLDCIVCLSIWVAMALLLIGANIVTDAFAVAGVALWIHAYSSWVHISK
jgi:cell division protein FtsW (lipid II flippase)